MHCQTEEENAVKFSFLKLLTISYYLLDNNLIPMVFSSCKAIGAHQYHMYTVWMLRIMPNYLLLGV